jgi:hypothetical protein
MGIKDDAVEVRAQGWRTLAALHGLIEAELERSLQGQASSPSWNTPSWTRSAGRTGGTCACSSWPGPRRSVPARPPAW